MNSRNKFLKTVNQLTTEEKSKISKEFYRIVNLIAKIQEDKHSQLKDNEFKTILKNIDMDLENISKTEAGYWAKYIFINKEDVTVRARNKHICTVKIWYKNEDMIIIKYKIMEVVIWIDMR